MRSEAAVSPKQPLAPSPVSRRTLKLYLAAAVFVCASIMFLSLLFTGFFSPQAEVQITASTLRSGTEFVGDHKWVVVDASLYNPGLSRRITVWAEITCQPTQVSYSKGQYVHIGPKESRDVTIDFAFDTATYSGVSAHRVWLTYVEQD
ncbi:MAG: hypothetical protein JSV87_04165 [Candidatus Bathyarchaeota archaeon]|nr:MAG: hypothetical protein JSV87_04165 [Candidatus Bathyarchaeota archaeon]